MPIQKFIKREYLIAKIDCKGMKASFLECDLLNDVHPNFFFNELEYPGRLFFAYQESVHCELKKA